MVVDGDVLGKNTVESARARVRAALRQASAEAEKAPAA
jgi:hypothetical protein